MWNSFLEFWDRFINPDYSRFITPEFEDEFIGPPTLGDITGKPSLKQKVDYLLPSLTSKLIALSLFWILLDTKPWK